MKNKYAKRLSFRGIWLIFLTVLIGGLGGYFFTNSSTAQIKTKSDLGQKGGVNSTEPAELTAFRRSLDQKVTPVIVELKGDPGSVVQFRQGVRDKKGTFRFLKRHASRLAKNQESFIKKVANRKLRIMMRKADVPQIDGSVKRIEYRFTYLLNGFVAYVATPDIERLRKQPEVKNIHTFEPSRYFLDNAIDYSLGTQFNPGDRRLAVYGANEELSPIGSPGHPETPRSNPLDGFEGQNINLAVIDSGVDYRHPMFGGTGNSTPFPRVSGNQASAADNRKVIYFYTFNQPAGDPTDDFGHGTLVASTAAGFAVDGTTPPNPGFGSGRDGTGIGPTITGARYHGTAPQARIMGYKVCGPAPNCAGDVELSIEDAASPYTLVASGDTGPVAVPKPVADVINLSLGSDSGNSLSTTSIASNNAALNGTIVVTSSGNAGPGSGTVGAPGAATLAIAVGASLDPGSVLGGDVLQSAEVPADACTPSTRTTACDDGTALAGPAPETGTNSTANTPDTPVGMALFPVAGGGTLLDNSQSAHYVYVDLETDPGVVPPSVGNRVALVDFTGTFAAAANTLATQPVPPSAILLITATESATAVAVAGNIPTFTINPTNADVLKQNLLSGTTTPPEGAVSEQPLRAAANISLDAFNGVMAGFSSRGPNDHPNANYRVVKPDVTAPGVGVEGAATAEGIPDETVGLASLSGYTVANGTSFSSPITAGAVCLIRQRVRNELGLDTVNLNDANYRNKRYDATVVSRALLQNAATNLRNGRGVPNADPGLASINDLGAGHINVDAALNLRAIMVSPTLLLAGEFNSPTINPPNLDPGGNLEVLLPTASFGNEPVVGVLSQKKFTRKVIIRDITRGGGGGTYNLSFQNNRNVDGVNFAVSFTSDSSGVTPITSVRVPSGGRAEFYVRVETQNVASETEFQWFVKATHSSTGQELRMPFYFRAIGFETPGIVAPVQNAPTNTEFPTTVPCPTDTDGSYTLNWTYTVPGGGLTPIGYRLQEGTSSTQVFFDNADEPLAAGANSTFSGSEQWTSQLNPSSASLAYFIPDTVEQNESLATINSIDLSGATGATLSFLTNQDTEEGFDFANVDVSNNGGASWTTVATYSGQFIGTREIDISSFAGQSIRIRFRMFSDLILSAPGWYVEDIAVTTNDFVTIADVGPAPLSYNLTRPDGTRNYRIAGRFSTANGEIAGPYSNTRCVTVAIP